MNPSNRNQSKPDSAAESTLRLIASLPVPVGLEDRIHFALSANLSTGLHSAPRAARVLAWTATDGAGGSWARSLAAAAIVGMVVGGGWGVLARIPSASPARTVLSPPHVTVQGGFSNAGAMRTPQTLNGPILAPVLRSAPKPASAPPPAAPHTLARKALHHSAF